MKQMLEGNKIKLRPLKFSDTESIEKYSQDRKITKYTFVIPPPFTIKQAQVFIKKTKKEKREGISYYFGIELMESRELIGMMNLVKIDRKNKNAEIGFWLAEEYQNKGLAKEALNLILDFGFKKLKLERIEARVFHKNQPAQKLLEKTGFKLEGRLRKKTFFKNQWFDDLIYGILKN